MELNREQIIKALECCTKDDCDNCPNTFGNCYSNLAGYALSLIKELTEQVEKDNKTIIDLYHEAETYLAQRDCLRNQVKNLTEENERWRLSCEYWMGEVKKARCAKSDTVRKMQERVKAHFDDDLDFFRYSHDYIRCVIDQIAKEMIGEEND